MTIEYILEVGNNTQMDKDVSSEKDLNIKMENMSIKVSSMKVKRMALESLNFIILIWRQQSTSDNLFKVTGMARENSLIKMELFMMDNGR